MQKQTTSKTQTKLPGYRVVVRGNEGKKRVRRVFTVHAANADKAAEAANRNNDLTRGLRGDLYVTVLPPLTH